MVSLFAVGTYLMIGSFIALLCWSKRDKDDWLADDPIISGLTLLRITFLWPTFFVVLAKVVRKRLAARRANGRKIVVVNSEGKAFHIIPAQVELAGLFCDSSKRRRMMATKTKSRSKPFFVVEAWVDGGHVGSLEAYWVPGNKEGTSTLFGLKDDWTDWTGNPHHAKPFPTKEEAEKEILLIREQKKEWSANMEVVGFKSL